MINSFGTGKTTEADGEREADGSGGSCSGCSAVRVVRLFGCSAVRAVRLFGCSGCSAVRAAAALLPRMAIGERSEAPTAAGASSSRIQQLSFSCAVVFCGCRLRQQRRGLSSHGQRRAQRSPHRSRSQQQQDPAAYFFSCAVVFAAVAFGNSGEGKIHRCDGCVGGCAGRRLSSPAWPAASVAKPPPAEKGFISLFILCPLHYLLLVCR